MTRTVYVHVGGPKTGTTYVQQVLERNAQTLARAGVLVVGPRIDLVHAAMAVRGDPRIHDLGEHQQGAWQRLVDQVRGWSGESAVLSYELFAGASAEQAAAALADFTGLEVHVVVSARDLARAIPSAWQEKLKFGATVSLESWTPPAESAPRSQWGWRTMQPANVAARWGAGLPVDRVHVVTVPRSGAGEDELWHRFADATGLRDVPGVDPQVPRVNESMSVVAAELLRRINEGLAGRFTTGAQQAMWLRDVLAHRVLVPLGREPIRPTEAQLAEASAQAEAAIAAIEAAGYAVHGDLADLRPGPVSGRLPSEVAEHELLECATLALGDLLAWSRGAGADPRAEVREKAPRPAGNRTDAGGRARRTARRAVNWIGEVRAPAKIEALELRVAELEAQLRRERRLQQRVASLGDLVQELLLPAAQQNTKVTGAALREYRSRSL